MASVQVRNNAYMSFAPPQHCMGGQKTRRSPLDPMQINTGQGRWPQTHHLPCSWQKRSPRGLPDVYPICSSNHYSVQMCGVHEGKKEKWNGLSIMKWVETGDARVERNSLFWVASLPPETMLKCLVKLPLKAMSASVAIQRWSQKTWGY